MCIHKIYKNHPHLGELEDLLLKLDPQIENENISPCNYSDVDIMNHLKGVTVMHLNIQGLARKWEDFVDFLNNTKSAKNYPDIIMHYETYLDDHNQNKYQLPGYNLLYCNRVYRKGSGVAMYVKDHHNYTLRTDLTFTTEALEIIAIEIEIQWKNT